MLTSHTTAIDPSKQIPKSQIDLHAPFVNKVGCEAERVSAMLNAAEGSEVVNQRSARDLVYEDGQTAPSDARSCTAILLLTWASSCFVFTRKDGEEDNPRGR